MSCESYSSCGFVTTSCKSTVFVRIVAVATINFSLAGVRLLIRSSYSRVGISDRYVTVPSIQIVTHKRLAYVGCTSNNLAKITGHAASKVSFCPGRMIVHCLLLFPHLLNCFHAWVKLLFKGGYYFFHYYLRATAFQDVAFIWITMVLVCDKWFQKSLHPLICVALVLQPISEAYRP